MRRFIMESALKKLGVDILEIEAVFFKAMLVGYVNNESRPKEILELPGYKCFEFVKNHFRVIDAYCVAKVSDVSFGFTTIWWKNIPVWNMNYGGQYCSTHIAVLKAALKKNYERSCFVGGRGPETFVSAKCPKILYCNTVQENSCFMQFAGYECLRFACPSIKIGFHNYFGGLLI
jgi:hypothetical protein